MRVRVWTMFDRDIDALTETDVVQTGPCRDCEVRGGSGVSAQTEVRQQTIGLIFS